MVKNSSDQCSILSNEAELEAALAESFNRPLVLLKHSEWCGWSQRVVDAARAELDTWAKEIGCRMIIVQNHRQLSAAIAHRLGIRHETPQIVVIRNGRATWDASHAGITNAAVRQAIEAAVGTARTR